MVSSPIYIADIKSHFHKADPWDSEEPLNVSNEFGDEQKNSWERSSFLQRF